MKKLMLSILLATGITAPVMAEDLVLLTTNDTHSNIDFDDSGRGGILPRKAIVDSVRNAEKNVILVDAGDMVQGSLYFKYFRGDVEYPIFNMFDYDIRILGNHEFDNGLDELAAHWKNVKGNRLSANYDFKGTAAEGIFKPYVIKKVGKRKIGFIGININPESLISRHNYEGMGYRDAIKTANETADYLKTKQKCDLVVAVTHIGYPSVPDKENDVDLARQSRNIDIIIGGHSHSFVNPTTPDKTPYWIENAAGKPVLVTQTGKYGRNVGYIKIDLDNLAGREFTYEYIPVTDRFSPESYDKEIQAFLAPYKEKVDSVNNRVIGYSLQNLSSSDPNGGYANWTADFALWQASQLTDSLRKSGIDFPDIDLAVMNVGGIRQEMPKGAITEGQMLSTFPFSNIMTVVEIKGKDIIDAMKVAAARGGEAISGNMRVVTDKDGNVLRVVIDGEEMDPEKTYRVMTIDYIAQGNDGLVTMGNNRELWHDDRELSQRILRYINHLTSLGLPVNPDPTGRFVVSVDSK